MESGLPRNIYTCAHSSRRVLTRHLIYHLLDPPNICEKIGSTCIEAGPIIVRIDKHCKISQLILNEHKVKLTDRSQLSIITVSGITFLLFA
jgi:hypothetical protein